MLHKDAAVVSHAGKNSMICLMLFGRSQFQRNSASFSLTGSKVHRHVFILFLSQATVFLKHTNQF